MTLMLVTKDGTIYEVSHVTRDVVECHTTQLGVVFTIHQFVGMLNTGSTLVSGVNAPLTTPLMKALVDAAGVVPAYAILKNGVTLYILSVTDDNINGKRVGIQSLNGTFREVDITYFVDEYAIVDIEPEQNIGCVQPKAHICDCGGAKLRSTHSNWCSTNT